MYDASCLRRSANWTILDKEHKFEKDTFNPSSFLQALPVASPKLYTLLEKIRKLDEKDLIKHGKRFKHFIFSDVKQGGYGAKIISSGLVAYGMNLCYNEKVQMKTEETLLKNKGNNFGFLCSTTIYEQAFPVGTKKSMLEMFNKRPDNVNGDLIRIMVADAGFKEGIDLFDVKYVHIFEPQTSEADKKQAIGRATRKCGQSGLEFHPTKGWTLHVFIYDVELPSRLAQKHNAKTLFDLYLKNSSIDLKKVNFGKQIEQLMILGAVDYPLTQNITNFRIEENSNETSIAEVVLVGGDGNSDVESDSESVVDETPKIKKKPTPPKLDDIVRCDKPCSINRPSKYVPVALPLFATVALVINAPLPDKKNKKPRQHFCNLLKESPEFCANIQAAFAHQETYVKKNASILLKAIENGEHMKLRRTIRPQFLRYVYKFVPKPVQEIIADMPNVQKALISELDKKDEILNTQVNQQRIMNKNVDNEDVKSVDNEQRKINQLPINRRRIEDARRKLINRRIETSRTESRKVQEIKQEFKYVLDGVPMMTKKMNFNEMRDFVVDNYSIFTWPKIKLENLCVSSGGDNEQINTSVDNAKKLSESDLLLKEMQDAIDEDSKKTIKEVQDIVSYKSKIATFSPSQDFIRHYLTPNNPYKGMLLWHSVGVGKTCTAIATATSTFEKEGWTILWVTRTTLKDDIWKNMFDIVCSLSMQERLSKGGKLPIKLADRMRLVPSNWSIRPMSYKQFTNLISGTNKMYQDLVKKNGADDPLKKTLIIIDEAHKLYGGYDLLPAEKPDMKKFKAALNKSYNSSGAESVKLLLMTATPYSKDPLEMVKLLNLIKENKEQLPTNFDEFAQVFLDRNGMFTKEGQDLYLNQVTGLISYLDRGSDAREFAQPKIELVNVPMSERPVADLVALKAEHDKDVLSLKSIIKQLDESFTIFKKTKAQQIKNELKVTCGHLKGLDYLDCKNNPTPYVKMLLESIEDMSVKINKIKETHTNEIKKLNEEFNKLKDIYENSISQEHTLDTKCDSSKKKK
jgi:Type III restriction enzyme, res subunit/Helicase conserved C-terminal domain